MLKKTTIQMMKYLGVLSKYYKKNDKIIRNIVEKITKHSFSKDNTTLEKINIIFPRE